MNRYIALLTAAAALAFPAAALASDAGTVAADARIVLAKTVRAMGADPRGIRISAVALNGERASFTWSDGSATHTGTMERLGNRWLLEPAAAAPLAADSLSIRQSGGSIDPPPAQMAAYGIAIRYAANDAVSGSRFSFFYARTPTPAEFLPYPTTYPFSSDSVLYFDLGIDGQKPIAFTPGTVIDVWFPFVLDDGLDYAIFMDGAAKPIGPLASTPVFDNTLHFVLPAFVARPGIMLRFEVDANPR